VIIAVKTRPKSLFTSPPPSVCFLIQPHHAAPVAGTRLWWGNYDGIASLLIRAATMLASDYAGLPLTSNSAICTALVAAPLRNWSPQSQKFNP
jgi:hypothetical protein